MECCSSKLRNSTYKVYGKSGFQAQGVCNCVCYVEYVRMSRMYVQYVCMSRTIRVYVTYSTYVCHVQYVCMSRTVRVLWLRIRTSNNISMIHLRQGNVIIMSEYTNS
jgi:hypothetical protein